MDFGIQPDHRVKIKESEKIDKYLDLAREQVTVIPIVIDDLRTVPKGPEKKLAELNISGWIEIIETTDC